MKGNEMKVYLVEMVDTWCTEARYVVWADVFASLEDAKSFLAEQLEAADAEGWFPKRRHIVCNGGLEVSDIDGRMFYKICEREVSKQKLNSPTAVRHNGLHQKEV